MRGGRLYAAISIFPFPFITTDHNHGIAMATEENREEPVPSYEEHQESTDTNEKAMDEKREDVDISTGAQIRNLDQEWSTKFESLDDAVREHMSKKLLWKVDIHLLPFLIMMYTLNYLDRSNLTQARQGSLEKDLHMRGDDFNIAVSILFVGYLLMQLPSNLLITRMRPSVYLGVAMTVWGVVSTCNSAVHSFSSLVVVRFLLGFVEAPFFPGAVFLMSSWYTRAELTRRISWLYAGNALSNMFGGLLAAAILGNLEGSKGIAGWRWLFIIVRLSVQFRF